VPVHADRYTSVIILISVPLDKKQFLLGLKMQHAYFGLEISPAFSADLSLFPKLALRPLLRNLKGEQGD
jgi:hypothetical protein